MPAAERDFPLEANARKLAGLSHFDWVTTTEAVRQHWRDQVEEGGRAGE